MPSSKETADLDYSPSQSSSTQIIDSKEFIFLEFANHFYASFIFDRRLASSLKNREITIPPQTRNPLPIDLIEVEISPK